MLPQIIYIINCQEWPFCFYICFKYRYLSPRSLSQLGHSCYKERLPNRAPERGQVISRALSFSASEPERNSGRTAGHAEITGEERRAPLLNPAFFLWRD
jgi:hypothetical protein